VGQLLKPINFIQLTFVTYEIKFIIKNESKIKTSPKMAKVRIFLLANTVFGSPPDVVSLIPANIIRKTANTPANTSAQ
jgi:hypothetical protein